MCVQVDEHKQCKLIEGQCCFVRATNRWMTDPWSETVTIIMPFRSATEYREGKINLFSWWNERWTEWKCKLFKSHKKELFWTQKKKINKAFRNRIAEHFVWYSKRRFLLNEATKNVNLALHRLGGVCIIFNFIALPNKELHCLLSCLFYIFNCTAKESACAH